MEFDVGEIDCSFGTTTWDYVPPPPPRLTGWTTRPTIFGCKGAAIRILGWGWSFLEINIFVGKMGEINKWPQGMEEIQPILR